LIHSVFPPPDSLQLHRLQGFRHVLLQSVESVITIVTKVFLEGHIHHLWVAVDPSLIPTICLWVHLRWLRVGIVVWCVVSKLSGLCKVIFAMTFSHQQWGMGFKHPMSNQYFFNSCIKLKIY
jgi:hypothetical protein